MVRLRLIVKKRSPAQEALGDLRRAADSLHETALYLKRIAASLSEELNVNTDEVIPDIPSYPHESPFAPGSEQSMHSTSELTAEDVEAALILANMQTGNRYTQAELEAAVILNMIHNGSDPGTAFAQHENDPKSQEEISKSTPTEGRILRKRPAKVTKKVSLLPGATNGVVRLFKRPTLKRSRLSRLKNPGVADVSLTEDDTMKERVRISGLRLWIDREGQCPLRRLVHRDTTDMNGRLVMQRCKW